MLNFTIFPSKSTIQIAKYFPKSFQKRLTKGWGYGIISALFTILYNIGTGARVYAYKKKPRKAACQFFTKQQLATNLRANANTIKGVKQ